MGWRRRIASAVLRIIISSCASLGRGPKLQTLLIYTIFAAQGGSPYYFMPSFPRGGLS